MVSVLGEMTGLTNRDSPSSHCWVAFLQEEHTSTTGHYLRSITPRLLQQAVRLVVLCYYKMIASISGSQVRQYPTAVLQ